MSLNKTKVPNPDWLSKLSIYSASHNGRAVWQLSNTIVPYFILWAAMIFLLKHNYSIWFFLCAAIPAGGLLVRIFILFHDCCHGSLFTSKKTNRLAGYITGILTFTPFDEWRRAHIIHHAASGNLDKRGVGDVWTMTVKEYKAAGRTERLAYRLFRNPLIMFGLGPFFLFLYIMRRSAPESKKAERRSVYLTNFVILVIIAAMGWLIGYKTFFQIQLPVLFTAGMIGIWLFYIQHQYENTYWTRSKEWNLLDSALNGSSYYKLPRILQWITGSIGFHHIHHLRPRIPNYYLEQCCKNIPALNETAPLTLLTSLRSIRLNLWDEDKNKLVGFNAVK